MSDAETLEMIARLRGHKSHLKTYFQDIKWGEGYEYTHNTQKMVFEFPLQWESMLAKFDDTVIYFCQRFQNKLLLYFVLVINAVCAIETGIALPLVAYCVGLDAFAAELTYLMLTLAFISQIPKRFIWRYRPFMVKRAACLRRDTTSSFPSRAVSCAVVYSYGFLSLVYFHLGIRDYHGIITGLEVLETSIVATVVILVAVFLSSYCRCYLGCHYPSDCMLGAIQGGIICVISFLLYSFSIADCFSCSFGQCYTSQVPGATLYGAAGHFNWFLFTTMVLVFLLLTVIALSPPLLFWNKCHHAMGMLFPCIVVQQTLLCPANNNAWSLAPPPYYNLASLFYGAALSITATAIGMFVPKKFALISYIFLFGFVYLGISFWRVASLVYLPFDDNFGLLGINVYS